MADCIEERITQNYKTLLGAFTFASKAVTVERERLESNINGRYPFIELCGPEVEVTTNTPFNEMADLHYVAKCYLDLSDDDTTANHEITYLARNVAADIKKLIKNDLTCGSLCQKVNVTDRGHAFEVIGERMEFFVYVCFTATARIDAIDSYKLA